MIDKAYLVKTVALYTVVFLLNIAANVIKDSTPALHQYNNKKQFIPLEGSVK